MEGGIESPVDVRKRKNLVNKNVINGKFINTGKLGNNILMMKYCSTNALLTNVKPQHISDDVKSIIKDIINDKYDKRFYEKINTADKWLIKRFVQASNLDVEVNSKKDDNNKKQLEILVDKI